MIEYIKKEDVERARFEWPVEFGPIGEDVYYRTYSRKKKDGTQEDWYDTCARVVNGNCNYVPPQFIERDEPKRLFEMLVRMHVLPAGRHLWATGIGNNTAFVNNCFGASFTKNFGDHFDFTFMRLMEGGGVGANYTWNFIETRDGEKAWVPRTKVTVHLVCDPEHRDYDRDVELQGGEEEIYGGAYWFKGDGKPGGEVSDQPTKHSVTGLPNKPHVKFHSLLSDKYAHDWDPSVANGEGPYFHRVMDSREGWRDVLVLLLDLLMSDRGEVDLVVDVSNVRPYGTPLRSFGGKASGPEALVLLLLRTALFMVEKLDKPLHGLDMMLLDHFIAMAVVSGGVRRSARMSMMHWKDPLIFDFINSKNPKPGQITGHWTTNISVVIDQEFLTALKKKDDHALKVYDAVFEAFWMNGEPGFVNASKHLEGEAPGAVFYVTNPCVTEDTWVMTTTGPRQVKELVGKEFEAVVDGRPYPSTKPGFFATGTKSVLRLKTSRGYSLDLTEDHEVMVVANQTRHTQEKVWKKARDLVKGDLVLLHNHPNLHWGPPEKYAVGDYERGWLLGCLLGDGNITKDGVANLDFWGTQKERLNELAVQYIDKWVGRRSYPKSGGVIEAEDKTRTGSTRLAEFAAKYGITNQQKLVSPEIEKTGREFYRGFLNGWFTADGSVQGTQEKGVSVRLSSSELANLYTAQRMLARLGIACTVYENRREAQERPLPDGRGGYRNYVCQAQHELIISGENLRSFATVIGFEDTDKGAKLGMLLENYKRDLNRERWVTEVVSLEEIGEQTVYDCQIPEVNAFDANGLYVHNCGEITMVQYVDLLCFDVCCLGHIVLSRATHPEEAFRLVARFLIRATMAPVTDPKQKANVERNRRIGVGFLGYHNWLVKRRIKYSEAHNLAEVRRFLARMKKIVDSASIEYSHQLRIPVPVKTTTLAPTGSIGEVVGVSTGCQAAKYKFHIRRVQYSNTDDVLAKILKEGKLRTEPSVYAANTTCVEYVCVDPIFDEAVAHYEAELLQEGLAPEDALAVAKDMALEYVEDEADIPLEDFLATQRMLQKEYVDNSISMTIFFDPAKEDKERFKENLKIFLSDIKGTTFLPDGQWPQQPLERLTLEDIERLEAEGYPIERRQAGMECANGACPIK